MAIIINLMVGFVAFLHLVFLFLEMFLWNTKIGHNIFKLDSDFAKKSSVLASNQGLYNGFLAAGLIWSLCTSDGQESFHLKVFFLVCVIVAGVYGAMTANKNIFFLQAMPAIVALLLVVIFKK